MYISIHATQITTFNILLSFSQKDVQPYYLQFGWLYLRPILALQITLNIDLVPQIWYSLSKTNYFYAFIKDM